MQGTFSSTAIATLSPGTTALASGGNSSGCINAFRTAARGSTVAVPLADGEASAVLSPVRSESATACSNRTSRSVPA